jgi:catechol 2,3-dioxygenase-like lactoylglutathione lyase family enzyme
MNTSTVRQTAKTSAMNRFALLVLLIAPWLSAGAGTPAVKAVESIGITVQDADRAARFYTEVLGFERLAESEVAGVDHERLYGVFGLRLRTVQLRLGEERIELMEFIAPRGRPAPLDSKSNDRWFQHIAIVVSDMDHAYRWLRERKIEHASSGPQLLPASNPNAGGIAAFYFKDTEGNHLEVLHFPAGKGDAKWQRTSEKIFLGIDHTAIVVADTEASLKYYRDALGLKLAGASENHGTEQEHLNNVFGARLRITALRAGSGPGVELLEYLAPRTGRPMPADTQSNDEWHWQVNMLGDVAATDRAIRDGHYSYVSPGPVSVAGQAQLLIRDPDGHAQLLRARAQESAATERMTSHFPRTQP